MNSPDYLIVTGASGRLGQLVLRDLVDRHGVDPTRLVAITRTPENLTGWKDRGVVVRRGDFSDPALNVREAFKEGNRALIIATDDMNNRRAHLETAIREAAAAGVKHIVYTGVVTQPKNLLWRFVEDLIDIEERVLNKIQGITYTVLGFNLWMETHMEFLRGEIEAGTLCTTVPTGKAAFISREDYAKACAAALVSSKPLNTKYEVTGPLAMDRYQLATTITNMLSLPKPLEVRELPAEELIKRMETEGIPTPMARFWVEHIERAIKSGDMETTGTGFFDLTGMKPESFESFLMRNKDTYAPKKCC